MSSTSILVPRFDDDMPLGRPQLEQLARPVLELTVRTIRAVIRAANLEPAAIGGVFLVGGSSRIPLAATLLHQALGIAPTICERPEHVVAEGSLHVADPMNQTAAQATPRAWSPAPPSNQSPSQASVQPLSTGGGGYGYRQQPLAAAPFSRRPRSRVSGWIGAQRPIAPAVPAFAPFVPVPSIVQLHLPSNSGYVVRVELTEERAVFLTDSPSLPLFRNVTDLATYLEVDTDHTLASIRDWPQLRNHLGQLATQRDNGEEYQFDVILNNLSGTYEQWIPEILIPCRDLAGEIADQLGIQRILQAIALGSYLDQFDDALRAVVPGMIGRQSRRQLRHFDKNRLIDIWQGIIAHLEGAVTWR